MQIDLYIERCGGIEPAIGTKFLGLTDNEIKNIESHINQKLPTDYVEFLKKFGASRFKKLVYFTPSSTAPLFQHKPETGLSNYQFRGSLVSHFYGIEAGENNTFDLKRMIETYANRMPPHFIPIADDGMGNQICIALDNGHKGHVYCWVHENEWDEEDYADDVGLPMPPEAKFQNIYLLADSLSNFFSALKLTP